MSTETLTSVKSSEVIAVLKSRKDRSRWSKATTEDAIALISSTGMEELPTDFDELKSLLLNGAGSWDAYSRGGCALVYNGDIAERYCTPSELKKCDGGNRRPNRFEEWLDVQTRALYQAFYKARSAVREVKRVGADASN